MKGALEATVREQRARIIAALAARYRDLDLAEDSFAEACARAASAWRAAVPDRPDAWLYRTAVRCALDALRKQRVRDRLLPEPPEPEPDAEDLMFESSAIPDERLRLIFVCCHPAVAPDARAALTLRVVCGLTTGEIARAFLTSETTLAQRLVRAKRKIAEAGVPFEIPGPDLWSARLDAVLSTLEIAYSKAHEDAAGAGPHAGYAREMLELSRVLAELLPNEPDPAAFAALVRYAEARRSARLDGAGAMVPLVEQEPASWNRALIEAGHDYLARGSVFGTTPRLLQAMLHGTWCRRTSLAEPPPWRAILRIYDQLLGIRDDDIVRLNRTVALAEVESAATALRELDSLSSPAFAAYLPFHAVRADLLRRLARWDEAESAYDAALALGPTPAERIWLERRRSTLA
jgi:RNA polymerase sigma-70 factor (ECF subfamily)